MVIVYGKPGCGYTKAACDDLAKRQIPYEYVDVQADAEKLRELMRHTKGKRVVPVIVEGPRVTIGFPNTCAV
jgi:glutaredoxin